MVTTRIGVHVKLCYLIGVGRDVTLGIQIVVWRGQQLARA